MSNKKFQPTSEMFQSADGSWRWKAGTICNITGKERQGCHWVKGAPSPNPRGRPKTEKKLNRIIDEKILPDLEQRLLEIIVDPTAKHSDILSAFKIITDRRFGKPKNLNEVDIKSNETGYKPMVIDSAVIESILNQDNEDE